VSCDVERQDFRSSCKYPLKPAAFSGLLLPDVRLQVPPEVRRRRAHVVQAGQDGDGHGAKVSHFLYSLKNQHSNAFFLFFSPPFYVIFVWLVRLRFVVFGGPKPERNARQGMSSVLKQKEFYDPRFITWIESRFDEYVQFCKFYLLLFYLGFDGFLALVASWLGCFSTRLSQYILQEPILRL
jgi:hypothetical protein